jgi:glycosyltransferase involved in cell wall biosynthesis
MHVGVDARLLSEPLTGIGRYTLELSKALIRCTPAQLSLYAPSPVDRQIQKNLQSALLKSGPFKSRLLKMAWSQTTLPYWANKDRIDLFWGATHRLPRYLPQSIARVVTIHDLVWKYAPQTMRPLSLIIEKRLMPEAMQLADLIMADSQGTADCIAETFPQYASKVRVVHLGATAQISPPGFTSLSQYGINQPYFLFVGTLEPRKNLDKLIQAYALLPKSQRDQLSLVIAGGKGWGDLDLLALLKKNQLEESVKLLGYVDEQQLAALYTNARFLAMPSIYEGFGLPLVEAMQYGTPVLTSNTGCLAEIAGDAGVLVDPLSIESISCGIGRLIQDNDLLKLLKLNAMQRGRHFTWQRCAEETFTVFKEALILRDTRLLKRP